MNPAWPACCHPSHMFTVCFWNQFKGFLLLTKHCSLSVPSTSKTNHYNSNYCVKVTEIYWSFFYFLTEVYDTAKNGRNPSTAKDCRMWTLVRKLSPMSLSLVRKFIICVVISGEELSAMSLLGICRLYRCLRWGIIGFVAVTGEEFFIGVTVTG